MKRTFLLSLTCFLLYFSSAAQSYKPDHDTTYYKSYKGTIIGRIYLSRKYCVMKLEPTNGLQNMSYHANTTLSLGLGITYKSLSFSFSKGLNFLKSDDKKGKTNFTDFQLRLYKRKWAVDAIASFSKGYYLTPKGLNAPVGETFYQRPDVGVQMAGLAVYRVLNDKRFTYGAALSQNAWQKKSAGSFLVGGEAFYVSSNADSAFVPDIVDTLYNQRNIRKLHLFEIGPSAGYAYTLVMRQHFFLMGSFNTALNFSYSREIGMSNDTKIGIWANYIFRLGAGYNSNKWNTSISWIGGRITTEGQTSLYRYIYNAGNYRIVYARRFAVNREMKKILN